MTESTNESTRQSIRHVFFLQSSCLKDFLPTGQGGSRANSNGILLTDDFRMPDLLMDRFISEDMSSQGRRVDNEELTLLGILDGTGKISTRARLAEFMVVMSRVHKVSELLFNAPDW